jgi:arylsulfatase A
MKHTILFLIPFIWAYTLYGEGSESRNPNIILLMADDMGYECLSSNGCLSYQTPVLDDLASKGIKFIHAYSQPLCTPSRVKIMTGKYNYRNYTAFGHLSKDEKTFGSLLKDAGYTTCVVGKWQLNGVNTKFEDTEQEMLDRPHHFGFDEYCLWNFIGNSGKRYADPNLYQNGKHLEGLEDRYGPDVVSDYAMDFMERNRERPFFIYYPMILVHSPFVPTPDSEEWKDKDTRDARDNCFFKDMVEYTDKIVQKLVNHIDQLGLADNTIFIFTADNGTHFRLTTQTVDGPYPGGKGTMPDAGTHVPMVIYNPGKIKKGIEYGELFEFSDFLPTFADLAGIAVPNPVDGKSFQALFNGQKQEARKTIFIHYDPLRKGGNERYYGRFVRNIDYKLYNDGRFYHVSEDSREKVPLSDEGLNADLQVLKKSFQAELNTAPPHYFKQSSEY